MLVIIVIKVLSFCSRFISFAEESSVMKSISQFNNSEFTNNKGVKGLITVQQSKLQPSRWIEVIKIMNDILFLWCLIGIFTYPSCIKLEFKFMWSMKFCCVVTWIRSDAWNTLLYHLCQSNNIHSMARNAFCMLIPQYSTCP